MASLKLSGNRLAPCEVQRICEALGNHPSLEHLDLSNEPVTESAASDLGRFLAGSLHDVARVSLRHSVLASSGAVAIARGIAAAHGLLHLDLSDNVLGKSATVELARALSAEGASVRTLCLTRCGLGPEGGMLIGRAVGLNQSLEELHLSDNGLHAAAGHELARSVRVLYRNGREVGAER